MRKTILATAVGMCICAFTYGESDIVKSILSRTVIEVGGSLVEGDGWTTENLGYGMHIRSFTFFDAEKPEGFYFGLFSSSTIVHTAGKVSLGDTRLGTIGWRGPVGIPGLTLDAAFSPVLGARITDKTLSGNTYFAASGSLGLFIPVSGDLDIGLSFEPTMNLFAIGSDPEVANKSYCDICVFFCMKKLRLIKSLKWNDKPTSM